MGMPLHSPGYDRGLLLVLGGTGIGLWSASHIMDGPALDAWRGLGVHGVVAACLELAPPVEGTPNASTKGGS